MKTISLNDHVSTNCEGVSRRDVLKVGALSFFGLTLPQLLTAQAAVAAGSAAKAESIILIWMSGGPSHLDTFDPKPNAPSEFRGQFQAIGTNVPGIQLSEHLTETAKVTDKIAIVRSLTSNIAAHEQASQYLMTGYRPIPTLQYPSYGSVVAKELGSKNSLPPYVGIPDVSRAGQSGFIGAGFNAFTVPDPSTPNFKVQDVNPPYSVDNDRMNRRRVFTERLNGRFEGELPDDNVRSVDTFYAKAYDLVNSSSAKKAFDLREEPDALRQKYGMSTYGQGALLARRLVEAGTRFVTVSKGGWDTHANNFQSLTKMVPEVDKALAGLVSDLHDRGMLDKTLVVAMGEFGRTPRVNPRGGRDHFSKCRFAVFAGAGIKGGQVIGKSDDTGSSVVDRPVSPEDIATTLYSSLGIDYTKQYTTPTGRPIHLAANGALIHELWG